MYIVGEEMGVVYVGLTFVCENEKDFVPITCVCGACDAVMLVLGALYVKYCDIGGVVLLKVVSVVLYSLDFGVVFHRGFRVISVVLSMSGLDWISRGKTLRASAVVRIVMEGRPMSGMLIVKVWRNVLMAGLVWFEGVARRLGYFEDGL